MPLTKKSFFYFRNSLSFFHSKGKEMFFHLFWLLECKNEGTNQNKKACMQRERARNWNKLMAIGKTKITRTIAAKKKKNVTFLIKKELQFLLMPASQAWPGRWVATQSNLVTLQAIHDRWQFIFISLSSMPDFLLNITLSQVYVLSSKNS